MLVYKNIQQVIEEFFLIFIKIGKHTDSRNEVIKQDDGISNDKKFFYWY